MARLPTAFVHPQEIQAAVQRVESRFETKVDHINFNFGENWIGEPSVFFRVVVRDEVSEIKDFQELVQRVAIDLMNEAMTDEKGLYAYFDGRRAAEVTVQDPAWA